MERVWEQGATTVTSAWCCHELLFGAYISARPLIQLAGAEAVLLLAPVTAFEQDDAASAARVRSDLRARGVEMGVFDTLIAGHALRRGWTLVTSNTKHFARVPGLPVVDWSEPA
jgi:tRNA(fMet)-specific endonuclease VapC